MRTITVSVQDEIMQLSSNNAGAAGSYGVVTLELSFGNGWADMAKKLYFYDAYGENLVYILLGPDNLKEGETDVYEVPIPAEPLAYEGDMTLTIRGVDGTDAVIYTASKKLKVLNSSYSEGGSVPAEPTGDQVEQLQAEIDAVYAQLQVSVPFASLYPHEVLTVSWDESIAASTTVNKTIAHTLGAVPSRVVLYFSGVSFYTAKIEAVRNGISYYYRMSGSMGVLLDGGAIYPLSGDWTTEHITDNYCFGIKPLGALSVYCGAFALSDENFRIPSVTFDDENITVEILNSGEASTYFLTTVVAEVYE